MLQNVEVTAHYRKIIFHLLSPLLYSKGPLLHPPLTAAVLGQAFHEPMEFTNPAESYLMTPDFFLR